MVECNDALSSLCSINQIKILLQGEGWLWSWSWSCPWSWSRPWGSEHFIGDLLVPDVLNGPENLAVKPVNSCSQSLIEWPCLNVSMEKVSSCVRAYIGVKASLWSFIMYICIRTVCAGTSLGGFQQNTRSWHVSSTLADWWIPWQPNVEYSLKWEADFSFGEQRAFCGLSTRRKAKDDEGIVRMLCMASWCVKYVGLPSECFLIDFSKIYIYVGSDWERHTSGSCGLMGSSAGTNQEKPQINGILIS